MNVADADVQRPWTWQRSPHDQSSARSASPSTAEDHKSSSEAQGK